MRLLVCGSRDWAHRRVMGLLIGSLKPTDVVIHGAAPGADSVAGAWATHYGVEVEDVPAEWDVHHPDWCPGDWCRDGKRRGSYGRKGNYCVGAGPRRNQQMLDEHRPDVVFAFKDGLDRSLKKGGTEDMMQRALDARIPVYHIERFCA